MFRRAQDRIRTYYYKTKSDLREKKDVPQDKLVYILNELQSRLKTVKYFGCYFDRNASIGDANLKSICNQNGDFTCQGRWDKDSCLYTPVHQINPYTSREERIIFQTWNLDHSKERSRSIVPAIVGALKEDSKDIKFKDDTNINVKGIFNDLFSTRNLKFVHIVCHDKSAHFSKAAGPYVF